jgi:murein DD-endopeptidase MepM/ murein hydrolase activator NlpD
MMKKILVFVICNVAILFFLFHNAYTDDYRVEISPLEISPGDSFFIKVNGADSPEIYSEIFGRNTFKFNPCGEKCFIAICAMNLDTKAGNYRLTVRSSKGERDFTLSVKSVEFPSISMTLPEEKVFLNKEDLKRAKKEKEKLTAIWETSTEKLWQGRFLMPLENSFSTVFGTKRILNRKRISIHRGIDIRGKEGEPVRSSNRGRVVLAEELFFGGNTIVLDHGNRIYTVYMHLSGYNVVPGDIVQKGSVIGFVGSTGRASGPHLHFGVKVSGIDTNPISLVELNL